MSILRFVTRSTNPTNRWWANGHKAASFYRYQSSQTPGRTANKKKMSVLEQKKQVQTMKTDTDAKDSRDERENNKTNLPSSKKIRKGFSSLAKVPSTEALNPEEILLDTFFQGYKPLTLPLRPPTKKRQTVLYLDVEESLQFFGNALEEYSSISKAHTGAEDVNKSKYEFSNTSFNSEEDVGDKYTKRSEISKNNKGRKRTGKESMKKKK
ncbi:hypothetical protein OGAPHI_007038 [Ogataea philodendri]|uniref:Uncharacterized protein n=1 Tax=Ogataea philodendri TaxID=1378263 RepID=A0A9P8NVL4_9ASCO|nr:uncharacterized protein OGAPHI_007038 [Ogataea philodendri]KAH3660452.1 hypothetical protein OGAPHI_007038 [Ogataea philodendri]